MVTVTSNLLLCGEMPHEARSGWCLVIDEDASAGPTTGVQTLSEKTFGVRFI
jgi:hypothetical protein